MSLFSGGGVLWDSRVNVMSVKISHSASVHLSCTQFITSHFKDAQTGQSFECIFMLMPKVLSLGGSRFS